MNKGFTFIEVLVAVFLLVVAVIAIVGVSVLATRTAFQTQKQVAAQALANEKIEIIHSLLFDRVGLIPSGATEQINSSLPAGSVEYVETITQGQQAYTAVTDIVPIDDPANGSVQGTLSLDNADYKEVRLQLTDDEGGASNTVVGNTVVTATTTVANWSQNICTADEADACSVVFPTPPETFTFENTIQMRTFVNSLGLYIKSPDKTGSETTDGQMYFDDATQEKLCDVKGYDTVSSSSSATHAPASSFTNTRWDASTNNFVNSNGDSPSNNHIATLTCSDPRATAVGPYTFACPATGKCTDAHLPRGFTPADTQYVSGCKSTADCNTGLTCTISTGVCS